MKAIVGKYRILASRKKLNSANIFQRPKNAKMEKIWKIIFLIISLIVYIVLVYFIFDCGWDAMEKWTYIIGTPLLFLDIWVGILLTKDYSTSQNDAKIIEKSFKVRSFKELCREIFKLLNQNKKIFNETGPNAGINASQDVRWELGLWNKLKVEIIVPNNRIIKNLIDNNDNLIPTAKKDLFDKMNLHILAFEEHCKNPNFTYSEYQFPTDFADYIEESCSNSSDFRYLTKVKNWFKPVKKN